MAMLGSRGRGASVISDINVTPLVDVMLVLLVIFMVTAPILYQGVEINLPQATAPTLEPDEDSLTVRLRHDERIFIGQNEYTLGSLEQKLRAIYEHQPQKAIFFEADRSVSYGFAVKTLSAIKRAGIENIGLLTEAAEKTQS